MPTAGPDSSNIAKSELKRGTPLANEAVPSIGSMIHCREVFPEKFSDSSPMIVSFGNSLLIAVRKYSSTALSASVTSVLSALISTFKSCD